MLRIAVLCLLLAIGAPQIPASAQQTQPAETSSSQPAETATSQAAGELPEGPPGVVATVGPTEIRQQEIQSVIDMVPHKLTKKKRKEMFQVNLGKFIFAALLHHYLDANKIPDAPDTLEEIRNQYAEKVRRHNRLAGLTGQKPMTLRDFLESEGLNDQQLSDEARYYKLVKTLTANERLVEFIKTHPNFFNGAKVRASHILISCAPLAPTQRQLAAIEKLKQIAQDVQSGKVTFAEAAHQNSDCPSGQSKGPEGNTDYGDLGEFTFEQMYPTFSVAAFTTKVGDLSQVVRSPVGFHLIQVTGKTEGGGKLHSGAMKLANIIIQKVLENQVYDQALSAMPIVLYKIQEKEED